MYFTETRFHLRDVAVAGPGLVYAERFTGGSHAQGEGPGSVVLFLRLAMFSCEQRRRLRRGGAKGLANSGHLPPG